MDLQIFAPPELAGEAKRFLAPFEVNSTVRSMRAVQEEPFSGDKFLLYLSGREDEKQLSKPLRVLARRKRRVHIVVLYAGRADRKVVDWARVAERVLPDQTEFCFTAADVARVLKLRVRSGSMLERKSGAAPINTEVLRTALGLTRH